MVIEIVLGALLAASGVGAYLDRVKLSAAYRTLDSMAKADLQFVEARAKADVVEAEKVKTYIKNEIEAVVTDVKAFAAKEVKTVEQVIAEFEAKLKSIL